MKKFIPLCIFLSILLILFNILLISMKTPNPEVFLEFPLDKPMFNISWFNWHPVGIQVISGSSPVVWDIPQFNTNYPISEPIRQNVFFASWDNLGNKIALLLSDIEDRSNINALFTNTVKVVDANTFETLYEFTIEEEHRMGLAVPHSLQWNNNGDTIAFIGTDYIQIINLTNSDIATLIPSMNHRVALSPDFQQIAIADAQGAIVICNVRICAFNEFPVDPSVVRWSQNQSQLISYDESGALYIWNAADMEIVDRIVVSGDIDIIEWSNDETQVAFISFHQNKYELYIYNLSEKLLTHVDIPIPYHGELEKRIKWHSSNQYLLVATSELVHPDRDPFSDDLWIIDTRDGKVLNQLHFLAPSGDRLEDWSWSPDGDLVGVIANNHLSLWELSSLLQN